MAEENQHDGCICHGNWREIVAECEHLIGKRFVFDKDGEEYLFFGVVYGDDDYYYGMCRKGNVLLLSCAGSMAGYGFTLAPGTREAGREH